MTPADVGPAAAALLRDDWGDRRIHLGFAAVHPGCRAFVADADGEVIGTGIATLNGSVGWIGTIWVDPSWRRHGLGMGLTQATIDAAEGAGCRTLVLVATEAGQRMYKPMGFVVQSTYRILETAGLAPAPADPNVRSFRASDLAAMAALDSDATGEGRAHLLAAFAGPDTTLCLGRPDGTLGGFVVRAPWGGGATIAPALDDAMAILRARRLAAGPDKRVRAGLLSDNEAGLDRLVREGWVEAWQAPRLIRGEPLHWHPDAIWGQFNHAIG